MRIYQVRIGERVAEKIQAEHGVLPEEAQEVLFSYPAIRLPLARELFRPRQPAATS